MEEIEFNGDFQDVDLNGTTLKLRLHSRLTFTLPILFIHVELAHPLDLDLNALPHLEVDGIDIKPELLSIHVRWFEPDPILIPYSRIEYEWQPYSEVDYERFIESRDKSLREQDKDLRMLSGIISTAIQFIDEEHRRIDIKREHDQTKEASKWYERQQKLLSRIRNVLKPH